MGAGASAEVSSLEPGTTSSFLTFLVLFLDLLKEKGEEEVEDERELVDERGELQGVQ